MIVAEQDVAALDQLAVQAQQEGADVTRMVAQVTPGIDQKLNPQGNGTPRASIAPINMVLRTPPGPVFTPRSATGASAMWAADSLRSTSRQSAPR